MGSSLDEIRDDENEYRQLCYKYGERPKDLYSIHHEWIKERYNGSQIPYKEYELNWHISQMEKRIRDWERLIENTKVQLEIFKKRRT